MEWFGIEGNPFNIPLIVGALGLGITAQAISDYNNVMSDARYLYIVSRALAEVKRRQIRDHADVIDIWYEAVRRWGDRPAIIFDDKRWTFENIDQLSNQFAVWVEDNLAVRAGQTVGLVMSNRPEYVAWWLALSKLSIRVALLNTHIKGPALAHAVTVAEVRALICDVYTAVNIASCPDLIEGTSRLPLVLWDATTPGVLPESTACLTHESFDAGMRRPNEGARRNVKFADTFGFVNTSGTTGLPKAAKISHVRMYLAGRIFGAFVQLTPHDRIYCCLPIYHSAGGMIGVMSMMVYGSCLVLARSFNPATTWRDIVSTRCTVFQYIGELCRYLVAYHKRAPAASRGHCLRAAIGNGLSSDIWSSFQAGFHIPLVVEFYAATEANSMLVNPCRTPSRYGFCGVLGPLVWRVTGAKIVSFDVVTEAPVRGPDGYLIEVGPNQTGELLFPAHQSFVILPFEGYTDQDSTQKKILANCFRAGDQYFRTGDLVRRDKRGRVSFEDRIGDTFRWKGENVSTTEVSQVVAGFPGVREANAYGVRVPGHNDRACMVAIYGNPDLPQQLAALRSHCAVLPPYARPLFLRILHEPLQSTSTFKQIKVQLKEEGCDPRRVKDALYWNSPLNRMTYSPLTLENYLALAKSKL